MMTLGEKIAAQRKELNYTQEQLAELLGVSRQSISKWESDIAYPETEKLVRMGRLFDCSMDYLLKDDCTVKRENTTTPSVWTQICAGVKKQCRERKSKTMVCGMPLYHIGRNARGFFAVGLNARGVFCVGLKAKGVVSLGLLSMGVISIGLLSLGLAALGTLAAGLIAVGSIAAGVVAAGAISIGVISFGALSVGCFSSGALAWGQYIAIGDHARGTIAIGESVAEGSRYSHLGSGDSADMTRVLQELDASVPGFLRWADHLFRLFLL